MDDSLYSGDENPSTFDGVNAPAADWDPSSANPSASSWGDVLNKGISRYIDAKTRPVSLDNTAGKLSPSGTSRFNSGAAAAGAKQPGQLSAGMAALIAVLGVALVGGVLFYSLKH